MAALPLTGLDLGRRLFLDNDEARFPSLAQDVLARGAWLVPELNGRAYLNKPTLLVWLIALGSELGGRVTQLSAALPSALAALGTAAVTYALGRDLFGPAAGRYALLAAVATQGYVLHARLAMPDMLMTGFVTASVWMFWRMTRGHRLAWLGFYGFAAAAFWSKGPAGLLSLAVAVAWVLAGGRPFRWSSLALARGLPTLLLLIAPWWVVSALASRSGAADAVVVDQLMWYLPGATTLGRLVDPFRDAFGILYPWVLVLPLAGLQAVRCGRGGGADRDGVRLVLLWGAVFFGAVALSNQQRLRYYLPLLPPASLLVGWWVAGMVARGRRAGRVPWVMYGALGVALGLATAVAFVLSPRRAVFGESFPASPAELVLLVGALGVMAAALLDGALHGRFGRGFVVAWVASAVLVLAGYHLETARLNAGFDYPRLQARLRPLLADGARVAVLDVHELPAAFYFGRPVTVLRSTAELAALVTAEPAAVAIVRSSTLAAAPERARVAVLLEDRLGRRAVSVVGAPASRGHERP